MIALPIGLTGFALIGLGTVLTAYGSGMFDDFERPSRICKDERINYTSQ